MSGKKKTQTKRKKISIFFFLIMLALLMALFTTFSTFAVGHFFFFLFFKCMQKVFFFSQRLRFLRVCFLRVHLRRLDILFFFVFFFYCHENIFFFFHKKKSNLLRLFFFNYLYLPSKSIERTILSQNCIFCLCLSGDFSHKSVAICSKLLGFGGAELK